MASRVAWVSAMYSASMLEREVVGCFFEDQEIGPRKQKMNPDMDFRSDRSDPQSSSVNSLSSEVVPTSPKVRESLWVPLIYLNAHLTGVQ